jgi:hypothetical protein
MVPQPNTLSGNQRTDKFRKHRADAAHGSKRQRAVSVKISGHGVQRKRGDDGIAHQRLVRFPRTDVRRVLRAQNHA